MSTYKTLADALDEQLPNRVNTLGSEYSKAQHIAQASQAKKEKLQRAAEANRAFAEDYKKSWAGQLDLSPDSFTGTLVNAAASAYRGGSNTLTNIEEALPGLSRQAQGLAIDDYSREAYKRYKQGNATPEDLDLLNQKDPYSGSSKLEDIENYVAGIELSQLRRRLANKDDAVFDGKIKNVQAELSDNWQRMQRTLDDPEASKWEKLKAMAGLATDSVGTAITNPGAVTELASEQAPRIAGTLLANAVAPGVGGAAFLGAEAVGEASNQMDQGVINLQNTLGKGNLGSQNALLESGAWAAAGASLDALSAGALAKQLKSAFGKVAPITEATKAVAKESAEAGFISSVGKGLVNNRLTKSAGELAKGFGAEALTGGLQTITEAEATHNTWDAKDVYEGAILEGMGAFGFSGPAAARKIISGDGKAKPKETKKPGEVEITRTAADGTNIKVDLPKEIAETVNNPSTNSTSEGDNNLPNATAKDRNELFNKLTDIDKPDFDIVNASKLALVLNLEDTSTEDEKRDRISVLEDRLSKMAGVFSSSDQHIAKLHPESNASNEEKQEAEKQLRRIYSIPEDAPLGSYDELSKMHLDTNKYLEENVYPEISKNISILKDDLDVSAGDKYHFNPSEHEGYEKLSVKEQDAYREEDKARWTENQQVKYKELAKTAATPIEDSDSSEGEDVELDPSYKEKNKENIVRAAKVIFDLTKKRASSGESAEPFLLDDEDIAAVIENQDNGLTESQRNFLRKFSDSRKAYTLAQNTQGVRRDIIEGNPTAGFQGLSNYNKIINDAISTGKSKAATKFINQLGKFVSSHKAKAAAIRQAISQTESTGKFGLQVAKTAEGDWKVFPPNTYTNNELRSSGGLVIKNPNATKALLTPVEAEANLLASKYELYKAQYAQAFSNDKDLEFDFSSSEGSKTPQNQSKTSPQGNTSATQNKSNTESSDKNTETINKQKEENEDDLLIVSKRGSASSLGSTTSSTEASSTGFLLKDEDDTNTNNSNPIEESMDEDTRKIASVVKKLVPKGEINPNAFEHYRKVALEAYKEAKKHLREGDKVRISFPETNARYPFPEIMYVDSNGNGVDTIYTKAGIKVKDMNSALKRAFADAYGVSKVLTDFYSTVVEVNSDITAAKHLRESFPFFSVKDMDKPTAERWNERLIKDIKSVRRTLTPKTKNKYGENKQHQGFSLTFLEWQEDYKNNVPGTIGLNAKGLGEDSTDNLFIPFFMKESKQNIKLNDEDDLYIPNANPPSSQTKTNQSEDTGTSTKADDIDFTAVRESSTSEPIFKLDDVEDDSVNTVTETSSDREKQDANPEGYIPLYVAESRQAKAQKEHEEKKKASELVEYKNQYREHVIQTLLKDYPDFLKEILSTLLNGKQGEEGSFSGVEALIAKKLLEENSDFLEKLTVSPKAEHIKPVKLTANHIAGLVYEYFGVPTFQGDIDPSPLQVAQEKQRIAIAKKSGIKVNFKGTKKVSGTGYRTFNTWRKDLFKAVGKQLPKSGVVSSEGLSQVITHLLESDKVLRGLKEISNISYHTEAVSHIDPETGLEVQVDFDNEFSNSGSLKLYDARQKQPKDTEYPLLNKVRAFTKQVSKWANDGSFNKPLALIKNFGEKVKRKEISILEFLNPEDKATAVEFKKIFQAFSLMRENLEKAFESALPLANKFTPGENTYNDLLLDLLEKVDITDENGKDIKSKLVVEQNVSTAVAAAVFAWTAENYRDHLYVDDEKIAGILGIDQDSVSKGMYKLFKNKGIPASILAREIGKRAVRYLGIKAKDRNTPKNIISNLEISIGNYALQGLLNAGYVQETSVTQKELDRFGIKTAGGKIPLFRINANEKTAIFGSKYTAKDLLDAYKGSNGIFDKAFGSDQTYTKPPSFKPTKNTQVRALNSDQLIPENLQKVLNKKGNEKNYIDIEQYNLMKEMIDSGNRELVLKMNGWKSEEEINKLHIDLRESELSKNEAIERDLDNYLDWVENHVMKQPSGLHTPFYHKFNIWQNYRVGIDSNLFNPQASKFHRFAGYMESWISRVDMNNEMHMDLFLSGVAEAFGINLDKNKLKEGDRNGLSELNKILATEDVKKALASMIKQLKGETLTKEDFSNIASVGASYENQWTIAALKALATMEIAKERGETSFTTTLAAGMDGVNNGPILFHLMSGITAKVHLGKDEDFLNKGGFFFKGQYMENYNDFRSTPGNLDLYESISARINKDAEEQAESNYNKRKQELAKNPDAKFTPTELIPALLEDIRAFFGTPWNEKGEMTKDGRDFAKLITQPLTFGASLQRILNKLQDDFIESILKKVSKLPEDNPEAIREFIARLNRMIRASSDMYAQLGVKSKILSNKDYIPLMSKEELLNYSLSHTQIEYLKNTFKWSFGRSVEKTLKEAFEPLFATYNGLTQVSQAAFNLFAPIHEQELNKFKIEVGIPRNDKGMFLADLSKEQEQEFKNRNQHLFPTAHVAFSREVEQQYGGVALVKQEKNENFDSAYTLNSKMTTKGGNQVSRQSNGESKKYVNIGVRFGSASMHSGDSKIMADHMSNFEALSNHDESVVSVLNRNEAAKDINRSTYINMIYQNGNLEMLKAFMNQIITTASYVDNLDELGKFELAKNFSKFKYDPIKDTVVGNSPQAGLLKVFMDILNSSIKSESFRLHSLLDMKYVNQYAKEGGSYQVTEEDRDLVVARMIESENFLGANLKIKEFVIAANSLDNAQNFLRNNPEFATALEKVENTLKDVPTFAKVRNPYYKKDFKYLKKKFGSVIATRLSKEGEYFYITKEHEDREYPIREGSIVNILLNNDLEEKDSNFYSGNSIKELASGDSISSSQFLMAHWLDTLLPVSIKVGSTGSQSHKNIDNTVASLHKINAERDVPKSKKELENFFEHTAIEQIEEDSQEDVNTTNTGNEEENTPEDIFGNTGHFEVVNTTDEEQKALAAVLKNKPIIQGNVNSPTAQYKFQLLSRLLDSVSSGEVGSVRVAWVKSPEAFQALAAQKQVPQGVTYENAPAWFFIDGNGIKWIMLNNSVIQGKRIDDRGNRSISPEDASKNIQEFFTHELLHAVLDSVLDNTDNPDVKALHDLFNKVKAIAENDLSISPELRQAAFENIHEFVAYGLTNSDFINYLQSVQLEERVPKNAFTEFMSKLVSIIFGKALRANAKESKQAFMHLLYRTTNLVESGQLANISKSRATSNVRPVKLIQNEAKQALENVNNIPAMQTFANLENASRGVSEGFKQHLSETIQKITGTAYGYMGITPENIQEKLPKSLLDVLTSSNLNNLPIHSEALNSGLVLSNQEAYAIEMIEATLNEVLSSNDKAQASDTKRQLLELWREARNSVKPEDLFNGVWEKATPEEKAQATELHRFLFDISTADGKSPSRYLARFAALGLGSEKINKVLNRPVPSKTKLDKPTSFREKLHNIFNTFISWFTNKTLGLTENQRMNERLEILTYSLAKIEQKYKKDSVLTATEVILSKFQDTGNEAIKKMRDKTYSMLPDISNKKGNTPPLVSGLRNLAVITGKAMLGNDRIGKGVEALASIRAKHFQNLQDVFTNTMTYIKGSPYAMQSLLNANKQVQKMVVDIKTTTTKQVMEWFDNEGRDLTPEQTSAITQVALRTGLHFLTDKYSINSIEKLISNENLLNEEINKTVNELDNLPVNKNVLAFYKLQAERLGLWTQEEGNSTLPFQLLNAYAISRVAGIQDIASKQFKLPDEATMDKAQEILERLITLHSIKFSPSEARNHLLEVMVKERIKPENEDGTKVNGIVGVLGLAKALYEDSKEKLFEGMEGAMIHGYVSEIMDQSTIYEVTSDEKRKRELELLGYKKVADAVPQDPYVRGENRASMYVLNNAGASDYVTGALSLTDLHRKGTSEIHSNIDGVSKKDLRKLAKMKQAKSRDILSMFSLTPHKLNRENRAKRPEYQIPVLNRNMDGVSNFRDMMRSHTKDVHFGRDNHFAHVLGTTAASAINKEGTLKQNRMVIDGLMKFYKENRLVNPDQFIKISKDSNDPRFKEIYAQIPADAQKYIREVFGGDYFYISAEVVDIILGYKSPSIADIFNNPESKNAVVKAAATSIEMAYISYAQHKHGLSLEDAKVYAKRAARHIRITEDWIGTGVAMAKQNIVIKTGTVLIGNIWSNQLLLKMYGVPLEDIIKNQAIAYKALRQYKDDHEKLLKLQNELSADISRNPEALVEEIKITQHNLMSNPLYPLVQEGLLATIAEDVSLTGNQYSNKHKAEAKISRWLSPLPDAVKTVGKELYMAEGTFFFDLLNEATQFSDLVAKYTLYQHLTKKKGKPHTEAIQTAMEAFVNYDIPLPRELHYLDKMGLLMFIKYTLSMQRVLWRLVNDTPMQVLSTIAFNDMVGGLPSAMDSSWLNPNRWNIPIENSIFALPESLGGIATFNPLTGFIK